MAVAVAIYVVLAVIGYWSAWGHGVGRYALVDSGDPAASMWFLTWAPFSLIHGHNPLFSSYGNTPYGVNMVVNTSTLFLGYLMAPLTLAAGPVVSYNVIGTLCPVLAAAAAYLLVRRFTSWAPAAFFGGLLYGFSPFVISQGSGHLHLEFVALVPVIFLALHDLVVRQSGGPLRKGLWLGALLVAQFFVSTEILFDTLVVALIGIVVLCLLERDHIQGHLVHAAKGLATAFGVAAVLLVYPTWVFLAGPAHIRGPVQAGAQAYRADLLGTIVPDHFQFLSPASLATMAAHFAGRPIENGSYLGLPLVAFIVLATVWLRRNRVVLVAAFMGIAAWVLSLGPNLEVANHGFGQIVLPEYVIAKLPVIKNLVPSRFSLFVLLFAALILGVGLDNLHARLQPRILTARVAPLLLGIGVLIPLLPAWPYQMQATVPAYFTSGAARAIPSGSVALVYPYPDALFAFPQVWQAETFLRFRMPGGRFDVPEAGTGTAAFSRTSVTDAVLRQLALGHPLPKTAYVRARVLGELRAWNVRTILAAPAGAHPRRAVAYLTWLLGASPVQSHGMSVWYDWRPPPTS